MNAPSMKFLVTVCIGVAGADLGLVGACASCQTPTVSVADAAPLPPSPVLADSQMPSIATPVCRAACAAMSTTCPKLAGGDCANSFTRIDQTPGVMVDPSGHAVTCSCIADAGTLTALQGCGIVCPP
jgi:hypothetical protein